jgi:signal peptidase II
MRDGMHVRITQAVPKRRNFLAGTIAGALLDQATKLAIESTLAPGARQPVVEGFFCLTRRRNAGGSFGLLADGPAPLRFALFVGGSVIAIAVIGVFYRGLAVKDRTASLGLGLILGGVIGNLVDRIVRGAVVDFLSVHVWGEYWWPDFNLADTVIVVGVAMLVVDLLVTRRLAARALP